MFPGPLAALSLSFASHLLHCSPFCPECWRFLPLESNFARQRLHPCRYVFPSFSFISLQDLSPPLFFLLQTRWDWERPFRSCFAFPFLVSTSSIVPSCSSAKVITMLEIFFRLSREHHNRVDSEAEASSSSSFSYPTSHVLQPYPAGLIMAPASACHERIPSLSLCVWVLCFSRLLLLFLLVRCSGAQLLEI